MTRSNREGPRGTAKDRALGLLAVRWRSRAELRQRLLRAGFDPEDVETALADLESSGLVDDERFAAELVRSRSGRRLAGSRLIRQELRQKGVAPQLVDRAVADAQGTEEDRAFRLAEQRAARLDRLDPETAARRLVGLLQRRGFGYDVAKRAAAHALAGAGWDPAGEG